MIGYIQAKYLKHVGNEIDVKVTIRKVDGDVVIYIRDSEFFSFQSALKYLQQIVTNELIGKKEEVQS